MTDRIIEISEVYTDGAVKDHEFRADVDRFARSYMPSIPMHLLGHENRDDYDDWGMILDYDCCTRFTVLEVTEADGDVWYIVEDTETGTLYTERGEHGEEIDPDDYTDGWSDEDSAQDYAVELEREHYLSECHGFPWAHGWGYLITDHIPDTEDLYRNGFVVFEFRGERIAGIDGGGYSFTDQHFAPLYIELAQRYGWRVRTEQGPARFAPVASDE